MNQHAVQLNLKVFLVFGSWLLALVRCSDVQKIEQRNDVECAKDDQVT